MQLYLYARSGHNFGLENIRRASAIYNRLKDLDPILCSSDYRAATFAKNYLGNIKGVGVDLIANMPNVMERGDMLIYDDSDESSQIMQEHMKKFCKELFKVGKDIPFDIVDDVFFQECNKKNEQAIFFADDDYDEWFFKFIQTGKKQDIPLIWGHYFFFKNEDKTAEYFSKVYEEDEYIEVVKTTKYLLTASVHTALESLAAKNAPVFFKRGDKEPQNFHLIEQYNIPVIDGKDFDTLIKNFHHQIKNYPKTKEIKRFDLSEIKTKIEQTLKLFDAIKPSLEYKF